MLLLEHDRHKNTEQEHSVMLTAQSRCTTSQTYALKLLCAWYTCVHILSLLFCILAVIVAIQICAEGLHLGILYGPSCDMLNY